MRTALFCLLVFASAGLAADPAWLPVFEGQLAQGGTHALEYLQGQASEVKKTADYQWALARACKAAGEPEPAAMALVTYDILTRHHGREVADVRSWLAVEGQILLRSAATKLAANDEAGAVHDYLHAAICDQALIQEPAAGLRDTTGQRLAQLAHNTPQKSEYWVLLAGYHFHMGHLDASRAAMLHYLSLNLDDYQKWRGGVWLSSIDHALDKHRKLAAKLMQEAEAESAAAPPAPPEPAPSAPPKDPRQEEEKRWERHRELLDLDARIRDTESRLREMESHTRGGNTYVGPYGQVGVVTYNQRALRADIDTTRQQLDDLKQQRDSLE